MVRICKGWLSLARVIDARGRQNRHISRSSFAQSPGAGIGCGAGGHDVIDQQDAQPGWVEAGTQRNGVFQLGLAGGKIQPGERHRGARAGERVRLGWLGGKAAERVHEQCRLVIAALAQPGFMQRHRDQKVSLREQISPRPAHKLCKAAGVFRTVRVFERQDQRTRHLIITQSRPCGGESGG